MLLSPSDLFHLTDCLSLHPSEDGCDCSVSNTFALRFSICCSFRRWQTLAVPDHAREREREECVCLRFTAKGYCLTDGASEADAGQEARKSASDQSASLRGRDTLPAHSVCREHLSGSRSAA